MRPERSKGIIEILLAGVAFGFLGLFGKSAFAHGIQPFELIAGRFLIAGLLMAIGIFAIKRAPLKLSGREVLICFGLGALGYAVFGSLFFVALTGLPASLTVLLLYTYPVMVSLGGALFLGEKLSRGDWVALTCVMVGLYWIVGPEWSVRDPLMIAFGLGSAVVYTAYILVSRRFLKTADPFQSACFIQLAAAFVLSVIAFREPSHIWPMVRDNWPSFAGISLICTVLAMSLFLSGLRRVTSTELALFSTAEPVTGVVVAVIILREKMHPLQWLGGALILLALIAVALTHKRYQSIG